MATEPDCIFCKIAAGQIPANTVLETDRAMAFLDIGPLSEGHVLVIPRDHFGRLEEMSAETGAHLGSLLPTLGAALVRVTGAAGYNVLQNNGRMAGQVVPHVHFHLIPRAEGDGLGYRWHPKSYAPGRAEELHTRLRAALATCGKKVSG